MTLQLDHTREQLFRLGQDFYPYAYGYLFESLRQECGDDLAEAVLFAATRSYLEARVASS